MKEYYVYILTNKRKRVLYVGVTNDVTRRYFEHLTKQDTDSFTAKYCLNVLVYVESCKSIEEAIAREKQLKKWNRQKKFDLIATINPDMNNLADGLS